MSSEADSISNFILATRRAKEIRNYFTSNGIFYDRLFIKGYGNKNNVSNGNGNGHGNGKIDSGKSSRVVFKRIKK